MSEFKKGDKVSWNTSQGKTKGTIEEKITNDTTFLGQRFKASAQEPKYKVKSDQSGKEAIHNPDSLEKE